MPSLQLTQLVVLDGASKDAQSLSFTLLLLLHFLREQRGDVAEVRTGQAGIAKEGQALSVGCMMCVPKSLKIS